MNKTVVLISLLFITIQSFSIATSQDYVNSKDPPTKMNLPNFWKCNLSHIEEELRCVTQGKIQTIAKSPGGLPIYSITYEEKHNLYSQANYNSAVAARNPAYYAKKDSSTKPVVFFLGPVHGHEIEGIVGLVNLIHVAETGIDHRGKDWAEIRNKIQQCRVIIVPCANPDGRKRCPYDSFVGLSTGVMTKYGQGTRKDGTLYDWPGAKAVHPMKGDVEILGAYFNDNGINPMHDDFFAPMADETRAIIEIARAEAPDMSVSLHSHENKPIILQASYVPYFMKKRIMDFSSRLKKRYEKENLPYGRVIQPAIEDKEFPPRTYFNLISALHHVSGTMAFVFECSHGSVSEDVPKSIVNHEQILDIQLILYDEMLDYILENRLYYTR